MLTYSQGGPGEPAWSNITSPGTTSSAGILTYCPSRQTNARGAGRSRGGAVSPPTHQRREVFRGIAGSTEHPDAETVFRGVRARVPTVSIDTVYRTLWLLHGLGLGTTPGPPRGGVRFRPHLAH